MNKRKTKRRRNRTHGDAFKIILEKHSDGYVAYPLGLKGVVVGEGLRDDPRFYLLLEPCSAPLARLDFSRRYAPRSRLPARGRHEWYLDFEILGHLS